MALSGGVDSAVSAHRLMRQGYRVRGLFLRTWEGSDPGDAGRVARHLGIELDVLDLREPMEAVQAYVADEYARGRTPNPCAMCNPRVKFAALTAHADRCGARWIATGHYARVQDGRLARAANRAKDQSYVLFGLGRAVVERMVLPMGELPDKATVRALAAEVGLPVADKPDSQEICFLGDRHYTELLAERQGQARPGPIVDLAGREVGRHEGVGGFTVGQRRGLRVAAGEPLYVVAIDPAAATVTIGPRQAVQGTSLTAAGANWHAEVGEGPFEATVQVRYNARGTPATVTPGPGGRFGAELHRPVHAITPGQAAVIYDGDTLLGGGWIEGP